MWARHRGLSFCYFQLKVGLPTVIAVEVLAREGAYHEPPYVCTNNAREILYRQGAHVLFRVSSWRWQACFFTELFCS